MARECCDAVILSFVSYFWTLPVSKSAAQAKSGAQLITIQEVAHDARRYLECKKQAVVSECIRVEIPCPCDVVEQMSVLVLTMLAY